MVKVSDVGQEGGVAAKMEARRRLRDYVASTVV
jgi:hypothetical protein